MGRSRGRGLDGWAVHKAKRPGRPCAWVGHVGAAPMAGRCTRCGRGMRVDASLGYWPSGVGTKRRHARAASSSTSRIDAWQRTAGLPVSTRPSRDFRYRQAHRTAGLPVSTRQGGLPVSTRPCGLLYRRAHCGDFRYRQVQRGSPVLPGRAADRRAARRPALARTFGRRWRVVAPVAACWHRSQVLARYRRNNRPLGMRKVDRRQEAGGRGPEAGDRLPAGGPATSMVSAVSGEGAAGEERRFHTRWGEGLALRRLFHHGLDGSPTIHFSVHHRNGRPRTCGGPWCRTVT